MSDCMTFPDTVEEFMEQYKVVDTDGIYMSKGAELVPIFRMRQWLEHLPSAQPERKTGRWILWNYPEEECAICSACGKEYDQMELYIGGNDYPKYCPNCGAKMEV